MISGKNKYNFHEIKCVFFEIFKIEPKCAEVKVTPLAEVALQGNTSLTLRISRKRFLFNRTRFPIQ